MTWAGGAHGGHGHGGAREVDFRQQCTDILRACAAGDHESALGVVGEISGGGGGRRAARYALFRAALMSRQGRHKEALGIAEGALEADGEEGRGWLIKGDILLEAGKFKGALECYREAEGRGHAAGAAGMHARRARAMIGAGMRSRAVAEAAAAAAMEPSSADAVMLHADALCGAGRDGDALKAINSGLAAVPDSVTLRSYRAMLLADMGEDAAALESASRAVEAEPMIPSAWYTRARVLARTGRPEESMDALTVAVSLNPSYARHSRDDGDFDTVRGDERFRRLVG